MNRIAILFSFCLLAPLAGGCDDDSGTTPIVAMDMAMSLIPTPPTLGMQIDRMGRPAINTALNNAFNPNDGTGGKPDDKGTAKNAYNAEGDSTKWGTVMVAGHSIVAEFASNLAIIDALDGVCGNQLLYGAAAGMGSTDAGTLGYAGLATVLVDDELYVDTSISDCKPITQMGGIKIPNYLAVEARAAVPGGTVFTTCGGRTPLDDVIDVSYTVLAEGATLTSHVSDGIDQDSDPAPSNSELTDFPFLTAPN